jgi:transposase InsO family protein
MNNLNKLLKGEHILGLTNVHFEKNRICSACQAGKQVGVPHPAKNVVTTTRPLELLHMDIFGLVAYVNIGGNKYGFVIVDDYSRYTWVFFMKEKSKVHEIFKKFATRAQNKFDVKIKRVRSDNATEFKNTNIEEYLDEEGIGHELFVPYTPQQNGIVERKNRTLIEARFWCDFHRDFYQTVIRNPKLASKNMVPIVQMRYIDWKYYEDLNNTVFNSVIEKCKDVGLYDLMGFRYNWNKEILAQFHCSYYYNPYDNTITWTTQGNKCAIDYMTFSRLLGLGSKDKNAPPFTMMPSTSPRSSLSCFLAVIWL